MRIEMALDFCSSDAEYQMLGFIQMRIDSKRSTTLYAMAMNFSSTDMMKTLVYTRVT